MGRPCHLTEPMKELWRTMKVQYIKNLEECKEKTSISKEERRCLSFVNDCVAEFKLNYQYDIITTPYGPSGILPAVQWGEVCVSYSIYSSLHKLFTDALLDFQE